MHKLISVILLLIIISSCNTKTNKKQTNTYTNSEFSNFKESAKKRTPSLRTPSDVAIFFQLTEADFMPKLTNNPLKFNNYTTSNEIAAANIGVYWTDALYQYSYKEMKGAKASAIAAIKLAETIGIGDIFKQILIDKYTENEKIDSFFIQLDESFMRAEYILSERARMRIYTSMLIGNYIQTQYILFSLIFEYPKDRSDEVKLTLLKELLFIMNQNIESTNALVRLIKKYEKAEQGTLLRKKIEEFSKNYKAIDFEDKIYRLTPSMVFNNDTLKLMYSQIKYMHNYITLTNNLDK